MSKSSRANLTIEELETRHKQRVEAVSRDTNEKCRRIATQVQRTILRTVDAGKREIVRLELELAAIKRARS